MRPGHVHFMVSAPGYESVTTHVFADGDPDLDSDAVFGVKSELIAPVVAHEPGRAPDGREMQGPYWSITYDIVLAPAAGDDDH
jgi:hydroxyquinol 1,2-dioxygenase